MPADDLTNAVVRIGDLTVELGTARVTRAAAELPLPKLSLDLLVALARAAPNLLTIDELMAQVWPGLVVSLDTVSQRVKLLREALGDDAKEPRYVAGVRGRGYRLVAPVSWHRPGEANNEIPSPQVGDSAAPPRRRWAVFASAAVLVALLLAWWRWPDPPAASGPASGSVAVLPFENISGGVRGEALALGIPEAVLHRLASLPELTVIARTSSFALGKSPPDVREIGRRLNIRYVVEGSVQSDRDALRVTAQLIDTRDGSHLWSMQFDRKPQDLLALQDDIARAVAEALQISVAARAARPPNRAAPVNFEAHLAYMQASALLASWRLVDLRAAIGHAQQAIRLDPQFATAYVMLAQALIRSAEFDSATLDARSFQQVVDQCLRLVNKALSLDSNLPEAYFQRAYLTAFTDLIAAEADYRRGLALAPNNSAGLEGLAVVLNQDGARLSESLALLDRARLIDPLEPRLEVIKATMLMYRRGDLAAADQLLDRALQLNPIFLPALYRRQELRRLQGRTAEGIRLGEQVLQLDGNNEAARKLQQLLYIDVSDFESVGRLAEVPGNAQAARRAIYYSATQRWRAAVDAFLEADAQGAVSPVDEHLGLLALRMEARSGRDSSRIVEALTRRAGLRWSDDGKATLNDQGGMWTNALALGDVLMIAGQRDQGAKVLEATLAGIRANVAAKRAARLWTIQTESAVLALLGQQDAAMRLLIDPDSQVNFRHAWQARLVLEPAFDPLRKDPRFLAMVDRARQRTAEQKPPG